MSVYLAGETEIFYLCGFIFLSRQQFGTENGYGGKWKIYLGIFS